MVVTNYLTEPLYSYKQASISRFVDHGLQMLTASVLMSPFEPLGHDCDPRYLKPTILAGKPKSDNFGYLVVIAKIVDSMYPISYRLE